MVDYNRVFLGLLAVQFPFRMTPGVYFLGMGN